ncbi:MAG: hypothetical protein AB1814_04995 [Thermodesulfobacteriota bacterium]
MKDRLSELRKKETLTDKEMQELVNLSPPGTFAKGPNLHDIGVANLEQFIKNFEEGAERSQKAFGVGCYMEVFSLCLQHIEFWLRLFWVTKNKTREVFETTDKRTFGKILNDCLRTGFDKNLGDRLKLFNQNRIDAIHKYLLGGTNYEAMKGACEECKGLDVEVREWVKQEIGVRWETGKK